MSTRDDITMNGWGRRHAATRIGSVQPGAAGWLAIRVGPWPSGLGGYFARLDARPMGKYGFAPFVRATERRLGKHRVAVVLPTYLAGLQPQGRQRNGLGTAGTRPLRRPRRQVRLGRPFLNRGVPNYFRQYDLPFLQWLRWANRDVEYLAQRDVEA